MDENRFGGGASTPPVSLAALRIASVGRDGASHLREQAACLRRMCCAILGQSEPPSQGRHAGNTCGTCVRRELGRRVRR